MSGRKSVLSDLKGDWLKEGGIIEILLLHDERGVVIDPPFRKAVVGKAEVVKHLREIADTIEKHVKDKTRPRLKHSRSGQLRCDICAPLRCSQAKRNR